MAVKKKRKEKARVVVPWLRRQRRHQTCALVLQVQACTCIHVHAPRACAECSQATVALRMRVDDGTYLIVLWQ